MSFALFTNSPMPKAKGEGRKQVKVISQGNIHGNRRQAIGGTVVLVPILFQPAAYALTPILIDERGRPDPTGYKHIQEGFDSSLPIQARRGLAQARSDIVGTQERIKDAKQRIDTILLENINDGKWSAADSELRGALGNLRFDLDTLVKNQPGKAAVAVADSVKDEFLSNMEALDLAIKENNLQKAQKLHVDVTGELANFMSSVGVVG